MAKIDNHNLPAKLELRRYFLRKYHSDGSALVMDCCQGEGVLWSQLRQEFPVASYWGIDKKPKKGRLSIDSSRILQQAGWREDVIDIDTYSDPWKHYVSMLPNVTKPVTAFLTVAENGSNCIGASKEALSALGLELPSVSKLGQCNLHRLMYLTAPYCVCRCYDYGLTLVEFVEAVSTGTCRYFGVRLEPSAEPAASPVVAVEKRNFKSRRTNKK